MIKEGLATFCPANRQEWRQWLQENHRTKQSVWVIQYNKKSNKPTLSWSEAVDEALCFGWIDSTRKSLDHESFIQFFSKRKPTSVWSKINKEKVQRLMDEGLMSQAGHESIERAKQNGSWTILDHVEELTIPEDLEQAFQALPGAKDYFLSISKSVRKAMLQWLAFAKRPETRQKRMNEIAELAVQKLKPKQFR
jgi:uncharacterized protein YdeI (YjbR/CyaY-like superfamily)